MSNKFAGTFGHYRTEGLILFGFAGENEADIDCIKLKVSYENEEGERYIRLDIIVECQFQERVARYKGLSVNLCNEGWYEVPLEKEQGCWLLAWFKDVYGYPADMTTNAIVNNALAEMYASVQQYVDQGETYYIE